MTTGDQAGENGTGAADMRDAEAGRRGRRGRRGFSIILRHEDGTSEDVSDDPEIIAGMFADLDQAREMIRSGAYPGPEHD